MQNASPAISITIFFSAMAKSSVYDITDAQFHPASLHKAISSVFKKDFIPQKSHRSVTKIFLI